MGTNSYRMRDGVDFDAELSGRNGPEEDWLPLLVLKAILGLDFDFESDLGNFRICAHNIFAVNPTAVIK